MVQRPIREFTVRAGGASNYNPKPSESRTIINILILGCWSACDASEQGPPGGGLCCVLGIILWRTNIMAIHENPAKVYTALHSRTTYSHTHFGQLWTTQQEVEEAVGWWMQTNIVFSTDIDIMTGDTGVPNNLRLNSTITF